MFTAALPILKTTDQFGKTLGSGVADDPFAANLVLALPMNGSNNGTTFTDQSAAIKGSGSAKAITRTNAVTSTAESNYYGSSAYFDGSGDYITVASTSDLTFGSGDFTIEYWIKTTDTDFNLMHPASSTGTGFWGNIIQGSSFNWNNAYASANLWNVSASSILNGTWHHVAICKHNGSFSVFFDGVSQPASGGSFSDTSDYSGTDSWEIGGSGNLSDFAGYIQDFRVYKGVAKYKPEESGDLGFQALSYYGNGSNVQHIGGNIFSQTSSVVGGTISDAQKAFNGSGADWANLTASSTSTAAHVDFNFQRPIQGITRIEAAFDSPSGSGDTRGRFNGSNAGATRTGTGSGYSDIYNGASITVNSVGFAINQNSTTGTNNDIVSRYRVTDSSGTRFLINGNGSNIPFKPDLVWLKNDDSYTGHHCLYDSVRGVYKHLQTSSTATEYTENAGRGLSAFNSDGFTLDTSTNEHAGQGNINQSGDRYSAYAWKAGGAATTIAAGSLHSAATNSAQTWSSNITTTGNSGSWYSSYPATHIFDATTTNYGHANGDGSVAAVVTLSFSPAITCNSSVSFFGGLTGSGTGTISINGGTAFNLTTGSSATTKTTVAFSGSISSIVVTKTATGGEGLLVYGFEIDGIRLTDNTAFTVPAVPSIASSVSTSSEYGFSIGTYSGTGSLASVAHNLGAVPELLICKGRNGSGLSWATQFLGSGNLYFEVNSQGGNNSTDAGNAWGADSTEHTFSIKTKPTTNETPANGNSFVFYAWKSVPGFSKISSYVGNAGSNKVTTGFRPSFLLIKADIDGEDWIIMDDARTPNNPVNDAFFANTLAVPNANSAYNVYFDDDGFTVSNNNPRFNTNTKTYYYMAIAGRKPSDPGPDAFKVLETLNTKDHSSSAHTVTNNGASFQSSVQKFYDGAAEFDSSNLTIPATSDFNFSGGDFTMECWFNQQTNASMALTDFVGQSSGSAPSGQWYYSTSNGLGWYHASTTYAAAGQPWSLNSWVHAALVRNGNTLTTYINGSQSGSSAFTRSDAGTSTLDLRIGLQGNTYWDGFIQDFRIYKGIAKYTSSF